MTTLLYCAVSLHSIQELHVHVYVYVLYLPPPPHAKINVHVSGSITVNAVIFSALGNMNGADGLLGIHTSSTFAINCFTVYINEQMVSGSKMNVHSSITQDRPLSLPPPQ